MNNELKFFLLNNLRFVNNDGNCFAYMYSRSEDEAEKIGNFCGIPCEVQELENPNEWMSHTIVWKGSDTIELSKKIGYDRIDPIPRVHNDTIPNFYYSLCHEDATPPLKANVSDSGFDLTLVDLKKENEHGIQFFGTGVKVQPPHGYYFDLVPRSSMSKSGFLLANSIGIIDQSYRGEIIVALCKVHDDVKLELPCKIVQIVPKKWIHMNALQINEDSLTDSQRGTGGFGSTGN